jgi:hypothetical protein
MPASRCASWRGNSSHPGAIRRVQGKNDDLVVAVRPTTATSEQYDLFKRYLESRHAGGGMNQMSFVDYEYMVEDTPVQSVLVEYRLRDDPEQRLVAVALTDVMPDGLSMVYSFYDPDMANRSLGTFLILDHIAQVRSAGLGLRVSGLLGEGFPENGLQGAIPPVAGAARHAGLVPAGLIRSARVFGLPAPSLGHKCR